MIFISHAWNGGKPEPKVLQFVDFLRQNGYDAQCDVMYQQEKTAIHFTEMMATALKSSEKTIIVLSENYKQKADNFEGGVGTEYRYIIGDFACNENRYILTSFNGRSAKIIPDFLNGRDIIDLTEDAKSEYRELFSKLSGAPKFEFSAVAEKKSLPITQKIGAFHPLEETSISKKLGLNFEQTAGGSDLDKKVFLKKSFAIIIDTLKNLCNEFCSQNTYFQIEYENLDAVTSTFEIYKNGRKLRSVQIWFGNFLGGMDSILISDTISGKNGYSQMITSRYENGKNLLDFSFGTFSDRNDGTIDGIVKELWKTNFEAYVKMR